MSWLLISTSSLSKDISFDVTTSAVYKLFKFLDFIPCHSCIAEKDVLIAVYLYSQRLDFWISSCISLIIHLINTD